MNVRVRFAPSPTGYLHIGGARTALFNWLYARHTGGAFVLRIEDTDAARNSQEAVDVILNGLRWLGLDWDEGPATGNPSGPCHGAHGPYFQSQRTAIYRRHVDLLLRNGLAYEREGTVRFRMPLQPVLIPDLVAGDVRRELTDREQLDPDFVIVRSDGQPVFHLVNVVDDIEMNITHVIRGEDHLSNTSKHIALIQALGHQPPQYAHIPLILNPDGTKMSKRDQGASLTGYADDGYAPEAVLNYLCLLGWSPKNNREVMPLNEVVQTFDLPQILRHNARFDPDKLKWVNWEYIKTLPPRRFAELSAPALARHGIDLSAFDPAYVDLALATCREKVKLFNDVPAFTDFYFRDPPAYDPDAAQKVFIPENAPLLLQLRARLDSLDPFNAANIETTFKSTAPQLGVKVGALVHPVRLACTGRTIGPSLYHLMEILGRDRVLQRIDRSLPLMTPKT